MVYIDFYLKRRKIIYISLAITTLVLFFCLLLVIFSNNNEPLGIDLKILDLIVNSRGEKYNYTYWVFRIITEFGYIYAAIVLGIIFVIYTRLDSRGIMFCVGILIVVLVDVFSKMVIARPRPDDVYWWVEEDTFSFPSGHSLVTSFMYFYFAYTFFNDSKMDKRVKIFLICECVLVIPFVMISRLMLSVHFVSDVLGGFLLGLSISFLMIIFNNYIYYKDLIKTPLITLIINKFKKEK